jgi:hypothetical protein
MRSGAGDAGCSPGPTTAAVLLVPLPLPLCIVLVMAAAAGGTATAAGGAATAVVTQACTTEKSFNARRAGWRSSTPLAEVVTEATTDVTTAAAACHAAVMLCSAAACSQSSALLVTRHTALAGLAQATAVRPLWLVLLVALLCTCVAFCVYEVIVCRYNMHERKRQQLHCCAAHDTLAGRSPGSVHEPLLHCKCVPVA